MLEVKHLTKVYSGKGGVSVKALDDVSVVFPETGMVFLLGKSGSGKSTLLNVAGGLDKPDGGEVIVKGKSSKDFSASDFDSYRNTFIGFVFQEYNILNEFTIEQNIALALQLQSKPNDKKAVADLLEQVDLAGYAKRKPNTLSGGQKQRVAIARALIKQPEIIMADEPTGALDSTTGKQVLDTLKKLSEKKLVIVVSHDREFAEFYGDRIIELKDGKIISDVSKVYNTPSTLTGAAQDPMQNENVALISENTIAIKDGGALTDAEVRKIGEMLRTQKGEVIITSDKNDLPGVKRACKINDNGSKESFRETGPVEAQEYDGKKTKFIKSRLPLGHAIKMGASGLKSKPFRLIFTILLAVAAFVLFGVASTFMLYDPNYSVSEAMKTTNYPAALIEKTYLMKVNSYHVDESGNKEFDYDYDNKIVTRFGASETEKRSKSGLSFAGVFTFRDDSYSNGVDSYEMRLVDGSTYILPDPADADYYLAGTIGFSDCGEEYMRDQGFSLVSGAYPTDAKSVALPLYIAESFVSATDGKIKKTEDLIGKKVKFSNNALSDNAFTVTGIYNVGSIDGKYDALKTSQGGARLNEKEKTLLSKDFADYLINSFHRIVFVAPAFYDAYKENITKNNSYSVNVQSEYYKGIYFSNNEITWEVGDYSESQYSFYTEKTLSVYGKNSFVFYNLSGEPTSFNANANGVYISKQRYTDMINAAKNNALSDFYWRVASRVNYVNAAKTEYDSTDYKNREYSGKDNGYDVRVDFVKRWQAQILTNVYLYKCAQVLVNSGDPAYTSGAFYDAYQTIQNYCVYNNTDGDVPTDAMWTTLKAAVDADLAEQQRYAALLDMLRYEFGYAGSIPFESNEDDVFYTLRDGSMSAEAFASVKNTLATFMAQKGMAALGAETPFAFLEDTLAVTVDQNVYYKDKFGADGSFKILGYYSIVGADWGAEYFITSSQISAHATHVPMDYGYQVNEIVSSYVAPADAKYNYLVSLTDNSMSQISAIFSTEKDTSIGVKSTVYEELQMFLELIKELEKIFLYVGLGVGVLAAFFLLNFISVSISAKKKDIGILRAVGARGSDVFKIFYAESFIIAFICFVLASVISFFVCLELNKTMVEAVSMKLLHFGPINIGLVFGISLFVSIIATFFPVYFAARKSPVEAIRAL